MNYACVAAMGTASGLRSLAGPAIISKAAATKIIDLKKTPFAWLASDLAVRTSAILAAGEFIADKLPFTPDRTRASQLLTRAVSGAICGMAVSHRRKPRELALSALLAGAAAVGASYAGLQYRKHVKLPGVAAALIEDVVAIGLGTAVVSALCKS